ncbi:MAG: hypothetical protein ACOYN4_11200 [Bacteroidales bacterium]
MTITAKAHARERRLPKRKPATNLLEVLNFLSRATRTEVRTIQNTINQMPSYMRGKELVNGN